MLAEENKKQFLIPKSFSHGFLVLSETAEFCYKCEDFYHPNDEGDLTWNDPEIEIYWPPRAGQLSWHCRAEGYPLKDGTPMNLSQRDQAWLGLREMFHF